jgi:hypothetical protein
LSGSKVAAVKSSVGVPTAKALCMVVGLGIPPGLAKQVL